MARIIRRDAQWPHSESSETRLEWQLLPGLCSECYLGAPAHKPSDASLGTGMARVIVRSFSHRFPPARCWLLPGALSKARRLSSARDKSALSPCCGTPSGIICALPLLRVRRSLAASRCHLALVAFHVIF